MADRRELDRRAEELAKRWSAFVQSSRYVVPLATDPGYSTWRQLRAEQRALDIAYDRLELQERIEWNLRHAQYARDARLGATARRYESEAEYLDHRLAEITAGEEARRELLEELRRELAGARACLPTRIEPGLTSEDTQEVNDAIHGTECVLVAMEGLLAALLAGEEVRRG